MYKKILYYLSTVVVYILCDAKYEPFSSCIDLYVYSNTIQNWASYKTSHTLFFSGKFMTECKQSCEKVKVHKLKAEI